MKKRIIRIFAVILVVSIVCSTSALAVVLRTNRYIYYFTADAVSAGNGKINISFDVSGTGSMKKIGASVIKIYDSNNNLKQTFSYIQYSNMMAYDTISCSGSVTYTGTSGNYYYAVVTFYAQNNAGSGTETYRTSTVRA